ncbi:MAG: GMP synthase [glutamine-hydrolyzing], amidotransferase subunit / GMP synthase [glutamine-hydrolyzing], ATP pyrophosphatase subunit, partial [uncultured Solirubrobacteraceae bacterium]
RRLPRAGHALLRRHRVRRRHRRVDDQVPPQRRRPARGSPVRARRAAAHAVQGRGPRRRRRAGAARAARLAPAVPGPRPGDPHRRRRGHEGAAGPPARRGLHPPGRDPQGRPVPRAVAVVLRPARHPHRRRAGRRAHLRLGHGHPRRDVRRRDDRRLGPPAVRPPRADRLAHDQRAARREPGGAGHHQQAAGDHRMGM